MENAHYCIIGAGSAGLSAGYTLKQMGMEKITILEASSVLGGRARKMNPSIADFPIDVGGEWISGDPSTIFDSMTGIPGTADKIETILHDINPYGEWTGTEMNYDNQTPWGYKFVNYTWYDFLNDYYAPEIRDNIIFDSPVRTINYENDNRIIVETIDDTIYECDRLIVTVSLQVLKDGDITFRPELPESKTWALDQAVMPSGFKVFMKFTETFYPEGFGLSDYMNYETYAYGGDQTYYDVTYGQETDEHILGLFAYYGPTEDYYDHKGAQDMQEYILNELDDIFDGKASETFVEMFVQDWGEEKYIRGAYSSYNSWLTFASAINALSEPIDNRIFLAGEAIPTNALLNGFVHTAAFSGQDAAERATVEQSSGIGGNNFCFSGNMEVDVQGKGKVVMKALQVGDFVKIGSGEAYEQVYAFGHHVPEKYTQFVQLHTSLGTPPLEMTGEHLVFVEGKINPVRADSIKVGDILQAQDNTAVVEKIALVHRTGIFNPLTSSGTIQVNGITASNYISFQKENKEYVEIQGGIQIPLSHHDFVHLVITPYRFYCTTLTSCNINHDGYDGMPVYVSMGIDVVTWIKQQHIATQFLIGASTLMLLLVTMLMVLSVGILTIAASLVSGSSISQIQRFISHTSMIGINMKKEMKMKKKNW